MTDLTALEKSKKKQEKLMQKLEETKKLLKEEQEKEQVEMSRQIMKAAKAKGLSTDEIFEMLDNIPEKKTDEKVSNL